MSENTSSKSFMHGAIILLIANALVKVIGAVFKIPLTYILGEEGMGYFSTSYQMYTWMFIIATAGIPVAISKMVSESLAVSDEKRAKTIYSVSMNFMLILGLVLSLMLFLFADFFASSLLKNPGASLGIKAISPAVLFVSLMSVYRGYFQGYQNMVPTAISEVGEAIGKLVIGFICAYILSKKSMAYASAGAVFGVSMGAFIGFLALGIIKKKKTSKSFETSQVSRKGILKRLVKIAIPITIGASVFSLTSLIDMAMIMRRLQEGGFSVGDANRLWGMYSGYAFPLFNLPPTLINAITVSIVPSIASSFIKKDLATASDTCVKSIKITFLFSLACSIGMSMLSKEILSLVYNNTNATSSLSILSLSIVFVSLVLVTNASLQAIGKTYIPVKNMIIGGVIKIITNYYLVANPKINIDGAPIGTLLCYVVIFVLNIISIKKSLGAKMPLLDLWIKPIISVVVMMACIIVSKKIFTPSSRLLSALIPISVGMLSYLASLFIFKAIKEDDVKMLPKGEKMAKLLKRFKLI